MGRAAVLIPLALSLAIPLEARATTVTHERTRIVGETAFAVWDYTLDNKITHVEVVVTNNNTLMNGEKASDAFVSVVLTQADATTNEVLLDAFGITSTFDFSLNPTLSTATLNIANIQILDVAHNNPAFDTSISFTWTGVGDTIEQTIKEKTKVPGLWSQYRFKGSIRDATASGSMVGMSTQFTPVGSSGGLLLRNTEGSMIITLEP
jgi:hypothetical protein